MYHFFAFLDRMKYIRRWSLMRSARDENIMEHSQQVAMFAHALAVIDTEIFHHAPDIAKTVLWALYGLGRLYHRRGDPLTLLSAAAGIILLAAPAQLTAAGFQLSFGAMVGIGLVTPWLKRLHCPQGRASRWVWNALCLTAGAQTGLLLPLCWWFQQLPMLGLMANLVVFPWASMLIYLYLLTTATLGIPGVRETLGAWAAACSRATVTAVQALAGEDPLTAFSRLTK